MDIHSMNKKEITELINNPPETLFKSAADVRDMHYGRRIFVRGLIEFTNYCKNNCYYCGIRCENKNINRYRLTKDEIISCCDEGNSLGFKTFVLQGGEDTYFTDESICDIIYSIKSKYPDCVVTLSIGEKSKESYKAYKIAGADRYLLRHETADEAHYKSLHPSAMSLKNRKNCLYTLRDLGYQVGAGFMVGSPYQTVECLAEDLLFLKDLEPHMVGIGPFIPHNNTPFASEKGGTLKITLIMLALTRLMLPKTLLPSTTALSTIDKTGHEKGFGAGANVVMPNLSPVGVRGDYGLYSGKLSVGTEAAQGIEGLKNRIENAGYEMDMSRGDSLI